MKQTRRDFLTDVGRGVLAVGLGTALGADAPDTLSFGKLEPLVALMQETPADKLLPILAEKLHDGTGLDQLLAGAALANARTFGGEDYIGFHTMMAIAPAFHMAGELPEARRALPVLKVLFRNANRIQEFCGPPREVLHPMPAAALTTGR